MVQQRVGIGASSGPNATENVDCIRIAEQLGSKSVWVAEVHVGDQFAILSAAAGATSRRKLGTNTTSEVVRTNRQ